ncbi:MAG: hypothetical protein WCC06_13755 [Candidatus Aminicenantales bacterium]
MTAKKILLFLGILSFLSAPFFAAVQDENLQNRQRLRKNIMTLRLLRMTQLLDLTEEQTAKIFPIVNRIEKEKLEIQKQWSGEVRSLRLMLKERTPNEAEINGKLESLKNLRILLKQKDEELEKNFEENLSTIQKAKYLLFSIDFFRGLGEKVDRARGMRRQPIK